MSTRAENSHISICDALLAATAATGKYAAHPLNINGKDTKHIDAAFGRNNPLGHVTFDSSKEINALLCIGCGRASSKAPSGSLWKIFQSIFALVDTATTSEPPSHDMARRFSSNPEGREKFKYWTPEADIGEIELTDHTKLETIQQDVYRRCQNPEFWAELIQTLERIVLRDYDIAEELGPVVAKTLLRGPRFS